MWPVSVTQLGVYYIRKRLLHVPTAFHGHGATKQINGLAYLHDIKGVRELKKLQFQFNWGFGGQVVSALAFHL
jgi:hypothetical protein